ncbi:MAG: NACHT domain-containing protein [Candidatus Heimdallarchaeota archaeon]|nr:NACHT domain-containing protein [Candidatus Heimdallarchaeota archaeon]
MFNSMSLMIVLMNGSLTQNSTLRTNGERFSIQFLSIKNAALKAQEKELKRREEPTKILSQKKMDQIERIDFAPYAQELENLNLLEDFREIRDYYIPLERIPSSLLFQKKHPLILKPNQVSQVSHSTQITITENFDDFLKRWAHNQSENHYLLLAASRGKGKTILLQKLAHELAQEWLTNKSQPVPLYIRFRDWQSLPDNLDYEGFFEDSLRTILDPYCRNFDWIIFKRMVRRGEIILILDGLDEVTPLPAAKDCRKIITALKRYFSSSSSKIILSSRPELFQIKEEKEKFEDLKGDFPLVETLKKLRTTKARFYPVDIALFDFPQIETYLSKRFPDKGAEYASLIKKNIKENQLVFPKLPLLLNMLAYLINKWIAIEQFAEETIVSRLKELTQLELFREVTNLWLDEAEDRERVLSPKLIQLMLIHLASKALTRNLRVSFQNITFPDDIEEQFKGYIMEERTDRKGLLTHDLGMCSFLQYNERLESFQFNFRTFAEFYLAEGFNGLKGEKQPLFKLDELYSLDNVTFDAVIPFLASNKMRQFLQKKPSSPAHYLHWLKVWLQQKEDRSKDFIPLREQLKNSRFFELNSNGDIIKANFNSLGLPRINLQVLAAHQKLQVLTLFNNSLSSIDLYPLWHCTKLQVLVLCVNQLTSVDLSSLQHFTKLQELDLSDNLFLRVDLSPLQYCTELQRLELSFNLISRLVLIPLQHCIKLQQLGLSGNQLTRINLSPLQYCTKLQRLWLSNNQLVRIDLSPLKQCPELQLVTLYDNFLDNDTQQQCEELKTKGVDIKYISLFDY